MHQVPNIRPANSSSVINKGGNAILILMKQTLVMFPTHSTSDFDLCMNADILGGRESNGKEMAARSKLEVG
jgi:hypothetical protein